MKWLSACLALGALSSSLVTAQNARPATPAATRPDLRTEILRRREVDQQARKALIDAMNQPGPDGKPATFDRHSSNLSRLSIRKTRNG